MRRYLQRGLDFEVDCLFRKNDIVVIEANYVEALTAQKCITVLIVLDTTGCCMRIAVHLNDDACG